MNMVITPIHANSTVLPLAAFLANKRESFKKKKNRFDVMVANGEKITQQEEGLYHLMSQQ